VFWATKACSFLTCKTETRLICRDYSHCLHACWMVQPRLLTMLLLMTHRRGRRADVSLVARLLQVTLERSPGCAPKAVPEAGVQSLELGQLLAALSLKPLVLCSVILLEARHVSHR
jgi:hypothetical protein